MCDEKCVRCIFRYCFIVNITEIISWTPLTCTCAIISVLSEKLRQNSNLSLYCVSTFELFTPSHSFFTLRWIWQRIFSIFRCESTIFWYKNNQFNSHYLLFGQVKSLQMHILSSCQSHYEKTKFWYSKIDNLNCNLDNIRWQFCHLFAVSSI